LFLPQHLAVLKATQEENPSLVDEGSHQWGLIKMDHFAKAALDVDAELLLREQCLATLVYQVLEHDLVDYLVVESSGFLGAFCFCWYF
jgi:hypothetical protein